MGKIRKILIANRGEIALRVIRTCKILDIESIAIYAEDDKNLKFVKAADKSFSLGEGALSSTYLNQDKIFKIAKELKVDAIHPGYGFLSENASFSDRCSKEGVLFIGPNSEVITLMGDKKESKVTMEKLGVPVIPGYHGESQEEDVLESEAKKIGLPLLIKASAGGGGKGMRVVYDLKDFRAELSSAKREAMNAFSDDRVLLERYIEHPRHIEVQVMSDSHGNHFHFWERECSIQRRHQKVIEETPSPALDTQRRKEICENAVKIARSINYLGAGTVEYILDTDGSFYFLEMNTRLQVEHPITEMVTGAELVALQIQVAQGDKLNFTQNEILQNGHGIEVRIYAEDPDNGFLPTNGKILKIGDSDLQARLECSYSDNDEVSINYDPMIAKIIVHGPSREFAISKMIAVLKDFPFLGVKTNNEFIGRVLKHPKFIEGKTFTHFISEYKNDLKRDSFTNKEVAGFIAASFSTEQSSQRNQILQDSTASLYHELSNWRVCDGE